MSRKAGAIAGVDARVSFESLIASITTLSKAYRLASNQALLHGGASRFIACDAKDLLGNSYYK